MDFCVAVARRRLGQSGLEFAPRAVLMREILIASVQRLGLYFYALTGYRDLGKLG